MSFVGHTPNTSTGNPVQCLAQLTVSVSQLGSTLQSAVAAIVADEADAFASQQVLEAQIGALEAQTAAWSAALAALLTQVQALTDPATPSSDTPTTTPSSGTDATGPVTTA